jgi:tRNA(fMet)-specific endonuclease VapC
MIYLLDTDICIFLLKGDAKVTANAISVGDIALSAITVAEVLHGAYYSADPTSSLRLTRALITKYMVIDLDTPIAETFGEIKANLRRTGFILADFDLLIGATAIMTGRTLVTNNIQHFQRLAAYGLTIENWKV